MPKLHDHGRGIYLWFCKGCGCAHWFSTTGFTPSQPQDDTMPKGPAWQFNGDLEKPTVRASVLTTSTKRRCHTFITDGKVEYLTDCNHNLAGKTIELPEFEW